LNVEEKSQQIATSRASKKKKILFGQASTGYGSGFSRGVLLNVLYEEMFLVKNRGTKAVLEERLFLRIPLD